MNVYIDIETIPSQNPAVHADIAASIKHPANMSKAETIEAWEKDKKPALIEKAIHKTGLSGATGEVFVISWAVGNEKERVVYRNCVEDSEADLLKHFFDVLSGQLGMGNANFVGHNVLFDLRFLFHRCVVNGVFPEVALPYNATAWSGKFYDTMFEWAGLRDTISLDNLCKALGFEGKGDMDGSMVWDEIQKGNIQKVVEYCKDDVAKVRNIYKKMNFISDILDKKEAA